MQSSANTLWKVAWAVSFHRAAMVTASLLVVPQPAGLKPALVTQWELWSSLTSPSILTQGGLLSIDFSQRDSANCLIQEIL